MDEARRTHINTVHATNALIAEEIDKLNAGEIDHLNVGVIENLIIQQRTLPFTPIQTSENAPQVFVGREPDIDALIPRLRLDIPPQDPMDVIAIHGMPGVGKTALLSALAYHPTVRSALSDGVLRVDLGPEPDILTNQLLWGYELGEDLSNYPTAASRKMRLLALCANKKLLIIIDNVWQAEDSISFLIGGPACRTIIATRNIEIAIALAGKEIYRLNPLNPSASLELLNRLTPIAQEIDPDSMEMLSTSLSGLPLALNMVGQTMDWVWRNGGDARSVLKDLRDRETRLRVSSPTDSLSPGKEERSIRTVFQVSYQRLPDESIRRAFRQLGVFNYQPAIFDLKAANAIWKLPFTQAQKTILILSSRALIEPVGLERYMLHALLADFATSLYSELEPEQYQDSKTCQAIHYLIVARRYRYTGVERWRELDKDWNNVRAAANWASHETLNGNQDPVLWRLAAGYATVLERVIQTRKTQDSELWLKAGTQACRRLGRVESRAWLNLTLGSIYLDVGKLDEATAQFQESHELFTLSHNIIGIGYAQGNLGTVDRMRGEFEKARAAYERVLQMCLSNEDDYGAAFAYYNLGDVNCALGENEPGCDYLEKCIELCLRVSRMEDLLVRAYSLLAEQKAEGGSIESAKQHTDEAKKIAQSTGSSHLLGISMRALAGLSVALKDQRSARDQYAESLRLLEEAGVREELAETHAVFARYLQSTEDMDAARQHHQAAVQIFGEIGANARAEQIRQHMG